MLRKRTCSTKKSKECLNSSEIEGGSEYLYINQGNQIMKVEPDLKILDDKSESLGNSHQNTLKNTKKDKSNHKMSPDPSQGSSAANIKDSSAENNQNLPNIKIEPDRQFLIVLSPEKRKIIPKIIKIEVKEEELDKTDKSSDSESQHLKTAPNSTEATKSSNKPSQNPYFKKYKCNICTVAVSTIQGLKEHIKLHSRPDLNCDKCGKFLRRNKNHFCDRTCKICNKKFKNILQYFLHMRDKHAVDVNRPIYECDICGLKSLLKTAMTLHMESKHFGGKMEKFICDLDGKEFKSRQKLYYHMHTHMGRIKCTICSAELKPGPFRAHMKFVHNTNQKYQCQICSKVLKSKKYLDYHMKTHDKKFGCKVCSKKFPAASKLRMHIKITHEQDIELLKCGKCPKTFKIKCSFNRHKKTHDKNRPKHFKCHKCDYSIDSKSELDQHLRAHERKEKKIAAIKNPVKCEKCPALCKSEKALKLHMKAVHPAVEYECDLCGRKIKIKKGFRNHLKRFHKFDIKRIRKEYKKKQKC